MEFNKYMLAISMLIISSGVLAENNDSCLKGATTQQAMNQCADIGYKEADAELNRVFQSIKSDYKDDADFLDKLKKAQLAWIQLRDADFALKYPYADDQKYYGSSFPMCADAYKKQLILQRIEFLKQWIVGVEEGDVCGGSQKISD